MDYEKDFYSKIETYPHGKISYAGETFWIRQLPDGLMYIDNDLLNENYRWEDIVRRKGPNLELVHRRWTASFVVEYDPQPPAEHSEALRKQIWEALSGPDLTVSFFSDGVCTVLSKGDIQSPEGLKEFVDSKIGSFTTVKVYPR